MIHTLRQQMRQAARPAQPRAGRFRGAAGHRACRTTSALSRSPPVTGSTRWWPTSRRAHDDYSAILAKALADRLAEAFAERLHERVRTEFWGYAPDESLDNAALIREQYQGIRPAPGLSRLPRPHREADAVRPARAEANAGITLTESFAMLPGASVSGYYFWRPESQYFGVGKIERDQVEDYARRKGMDVADGGALAGAQPRLRAIACRTLRDLLADGRVHVVDGAMGTMLYGRGVFLNVCYDELNLRQPELVREIHREYVRAGRRDARDQHLRRQPAQAREHGLADETERINAAAAGLAREAAGARAAVVGAIGPLGVRIEPFGELSVDEARGALRAPGARAPGGGVDGFILETFSDVNELGAARAGGARLLRPARDRADDGRAPTARPTTAPTRWCSARARAMGGT